MVMKEFCGPFYKVPQKVPMGMGYTDLEVSNSRTLPCILGFSHFPISLSLSCIPRLPGITF